MRSGGGAALQESQIVAFFATINNRLLISLATHASELQNSSVRSNAHPPVAELVRAWGSARCGPPNSWSTGQRSAAEPVAADVSRRGLPGADWAGSSASPGRPDRLLPGTPALSARRPISARPPACFGAFQARPALLRFALRGPTSLMRSRSVVHRASASE